MNISGVLRFGVPALCAAVIVSILSPFAALAADIPAGIPIPVEMTTDATDAGAIVTYKITADVKDTRGDLLIPTGSTGSGRVLQRRAGQNFGNPGKTEVSIDEVTLPDGRKKSVSAKFTRYGGDSRVATILLAGLLVGLFIKGGSGKLNQGSHFTFVAR